MLQRVDEGVGAPHLATRRLGQSSLELPRLCFGAWPLGGIDWGGVDEERGLRAIRAALDAGMIAIDTAPAYGEGRSERIVGEGIRGRRDEVLLMTKAGMRWPGEPGPPLTETRRRGVFYRDCRPEALRLGVEQSLRRLRVETIDLLQIHWPDPETPISDTMGALIDLRQAGKIREIGVCNYPLPELREIRLHLGDVPLASVQCSYSVLSREVESDVMPWAVEHEVGVLAYAPLEHGLLTGKAPSSRKFPADDHRARHPLYRKHNSELVDKTLLETVSPIARRHGATVAQTMLSWVIAHDGITAALVGIRSEDQVNENVRVVDELSAEEILEIEDAFPEIRTKAPSILDWLRGLG